MNTIDLSGKVALVTGGSRGLGKAMALGLAKAGADIIVASRKLDSCEALCEEIRQLGMRATAGTFGDFTFETRADPPSIGRFTNVEVDDQGHFRSGDVDFKLHAEFAVPYTEALPIRVGMRYEFGLSDWSFEGMSEDLGRIDFRQREGTASNVVFDRIESDRAGTLLHGWADFTLRGTMKVDF